MTSIFVVASHTHAAQRKINEIRQYRETTRLVGDDQEILLIPVLGDTDMRGRRVDRGDAVVVCGDWSRRGDYEIRTLCEMFNSRRADHTVPELRYRSGEAPEVYHHHPSNPAVGETTYDPITQTVSVFNGQNYVAVQPGGNMTAMGIETQVPPAPTTTTSAGVAWGQVLPPSQQSIVADARDEAKRERNIAADMRKQVKKVQDENRVLREWLSGVQPVEDPDLPGLLYCGVCGHRLGGIDEHLDGCPAAP